MQQDPQDATTFVLHPHRSLSPRGFLIFMAVISIVSFAVGIAFALMGAWPVLGFFGLDVGLIYLAFKLNYRDGRAFETVRVSHDLLRWSSVDKRGHRTVVDMNPYWTRVHLTADRPDGRTSLRIAAQGREILVGTCLTDDERLSFANALRDTLITMRGGVRV